jgi:hypothetical protein
MHAWLSIGRLADTPYSGQICSIPGDYDFGNALATSSAANPVGTTG